MVQQRRAFLNVPDYHKTKQNDREFYVLDDPQFEPENADFLIGYIGDVSALTDEDLARTPQILEDTPERQKYQLGIGTVFIDPDTQQRLTAAYYTDLTGQISANGGIVDDPNRVFGTNYYAWTPPIDFDKHINFGRYFWMAPGAGDVAGEFIIKEPQGSKVTIYEFDGSSFVKKDVKPVLTLPATGTVGDYVELSSNPSRFIYRYTGTEWIVNEFRTVADIPTSSAGLSVGDTFYVARTGPEFNRPLVWEYSHEARRWIAKQVVVDIEEPDLTREGMIWEDMRVPRTRKLRIFQNNLWNELVYTAADGPSGVGNDGDYIYDSRDYNDITDEWSNNNWWRHLEDLSAVDRAFVLSEDQATRPIIEFWAGLEQNGFIDRDGDTVRDRNDPPLYKKYAYVLETNEIVDTNEVTTIFEYVEGAGVDDLVLGFPFVFTDSGEITFDLTLESDTSTFEGYKFFKDEITGFVHSVWHKSDQRLEQEVDADGLYEIPRSISSNPDHQILTQSSRSQYLLHMTSVIAGQEDFSGDQFGPNSWRWSKKSPARGSTIIDSEQTLLRAMALLQNPSIGGMPEVIRRLAGEYNKVLFRFTNKMNQKWDSLDLSDPAGTLIVTAEEAVDAILTELFAGRNEQFPYFYSDMGTYQETRITSGSVEVVDTTRKPIFIPPSPARVGPAPCYTPGSFMDRDGVTRLRGHEGYTLQSFGDDRDQVWLELQNRFFGAVPAFYKTESDTFSTRFAPSNFWLGDYFGDLIPNTGTDPVDEVVNNYEDIVAPTQNQRVFSLAQGVFANYDGFTWLLRQAVVDEVFLNNADSEYYVFNGLGTHVIDRWNRPVTWDYSDGEFRQILRREFERFILLREDDFAENTEFEPSDPFTWNYSSAGVEGHYRGIYRRVYNTIRPHSQPWEVVGYAIEPSWWRTQYVPTSTETDGTPRYSDSHPMWADLQAGIVNPISGAQRDDLRMVGPIPVDADGELLDPIAAGVVDPDKLDQQRIDDVWTYGDGFDTEQEFIDSAFYPWSYSLQGYLMKNGVWTDTVWSEVYITIGLDSTLKIGSAPHVIHRDTLTRPAIADLPVHLEQLEDGSVVQRLGVNAWVSEYLQVIGASPTNDFARVLKNTVPGLSWKCSGFIRDNRTTITLLSGEDVPFEDVHTILHASQPIDEQFCSGVVIVRENPVGYRVFGFDTTRPFFRIELPQTPVFGAQTEQRESWVAEPDQHEFETESLALPFNVDNNDTANLSVIINGLRIKPQHITVTSKSTFVLEDKVEIEGGEEITATVVTTNTNPSTKIRQFRIQGVNFPYTQNGNGQIVEVEYGRYFETSSEVINFLLGYGRVLKSEGWVFEDIDDTTGQQMDWLFGAKRFAAWVLDNESIWQSSQSRATPVGSRTRFEYSPIARKAQYNIPFGQNFNVESIQNGVYGIINQDSVPIDSADTFSARVGGTLEVEVNEEAQAAQQMFGLMINISEIEHVVFLSNVTRFNNLIYDPVTALFHKTLRVDSYRTNEWEGRLEAPGYIVSGGTLIPNFEKNAFDFTRFYDRIQPLDDPIKRDQARNLYGWYPADEYMDPIGAADRSRFDYYRGMINAKGTIRPVIAYARGTRLGRDNAFVYEDWAWKVAEFGDVRRDKIQFNLNKNELRDEATVICFGCGDDRFNNTLEIPDFNRTNTVIGGVYIPDLPAPQFLTGMDFNIQVNSKSATITLDNDNELFDAIIEINTLLAAENITEVECFSADGFLAFRNTLNSTVTPYTLLSGIAPTDILTLAGINPGNYTVDNSRWIMPPEVGQDGISNVVFPITADGMPDVTDNDFFSKTFDTEPLATINQHFHFDPLLGKFDPAARALVDLVEILDPARYNRGPETSRSNNLVWGENQVGMLWWDVTRANFVDYKRPFDGSDLTTFPVEDYEAAAKIWGRLRFTRANITRVDEVATVQTVDIFTGDPVEHGLLTGDTVSIIDAEPEDWNVTDQPIYLSPISVTGDIEFQPGDAIGTIEVPDTVTTTGETIYDETNTVTGSTEFVDTNIVEGLNGDAFMRPGDAFRIFMPSKTIQVDFQTFSGGNASAFAQEINDVFVSANIFEVEAYSNFDDFIGGQVLGLRNTLNREGIPFELSHIESAFSGTINLDALPAPQQPQTGDEFGVTTDSASQVIFITGFTTTLALATEINGKLTTAGITEVEAYDNAGFLAFRTTAGNEAETYTLSSGLQGPDLLAKAGIDPGRYGSVLTKAGIAAGTYDAATIPGVDELGVGNAPSFDLFTDSDLLHVADISDGTYMSSVSGVEDLSDRIMRAGTQFDFEFNRTLSAPYTTTQTTIANVVTEFNNYLVAQGVVAVQVAATGTLELKMEFTNLAPADVAFEIPVSYSIVGTVVTPAFAIGDDFDITTTSGTVNFVSTVAGDQSALVPDINSQLTGGGITEVEAYDDNGRLAFRNTTGNESEFFTLVAGTVNDVLATAGISPGTYRNLWVVAGMPNGVYTPDNIGDAVGTVTNPTFAAGDTGDIPYIRTRFEFVSEEDNDLDGLVDEINGSFTSNSLDADIQAVNLGGFLQFNLLSTNEFVLTRKGGIEFENPESIGIVGVVSAINQALQDANIFDVEAFFDEFSLGIRNTIGNEGRPFELVAGSPDLLALAGITAGIYEIIPVGYSFNIETRSGQFPVNPYITRFSAGLDDIVDDINEWASDEGLTEVQAINSTQRLSFQNTAGNEGKGFRLISGSPDDLLGAAPGAAFSFIPGAYFDVIPANAGFVLETSSGKLQFNFSGGNLPALVDEINNALPFASTIGRNVNVYGVGADFKITVFSNTTKILNFSSTIAGATFDIANEINSQLSTAGITEIIAEDISGYLQIRNNLSIPEIAFLLEPGTVDDLLATADIEARLYGGITEVEASSSQNFLVIKNVEGRESENFMLSSGTGSIGHPLSTTDLLSTVGIAATSYGQYEAEAGFQIFLGNGKQLTFVTPDGGSLTKVIGEINSDFQRLNIVEVEAVEVDNKITIQNTEGYSGTSFILKGPVSGQNLLDATGLNPGTVDSGIVAVDFDIVGVDVGLTGSFTVEGDFRKIFSPGTAFTVSGSTGNDGLYTTTASSLDANGNTFITTSQPVISTVADGEISGDFYGYQTDPTTFSFEVQTEPDSPATGDPKVVLGFIDLYEWVRSPVPPQQWADYTATLTAPDRPTGTPLNVDDPSYVELVSTNSRTGQNESTYYFWVKDNTGNNLAKELPTNVIADRLESPTAQAIPWFAPMDVDHMVIFQGTVKVEDDYAIELIIDARDLETHVEWAIVSENDQFNEVPQVIVDKIIDSLSGVDDKGSMVPSPLLNEFEKYGSSFFPIQTIFSDRDMAVDVYIEAINNLLAAKDLSRFDPLVSIFQLSDELSDIHNPNGFWQRTKYVDADYVGQEIYDTVVTEAERDSRGAEGRYANGDLVDVLQSGNLDPWIGGPYPIASSSSAGSSFTIVGDYTDRFREGESFVVLLSSANDGQYNVSSAGSTFDGTNTTVFVTEPVVDSTDDGNIEGRVTTTYVYQDGLFVEAGVENHTIAINTNITADTSKFRSTYERTYEVLERIEQNNFVFSMLYEMMRQHINADWFIKTSYISTQIFDTISRSPFVRASEPQAILENIQDVKPFRTKFRRQSETWTVQEVEPVPTEILEFPDIKTTILVDRLSCDDMEDGGWDASYWDNLDDPPFVGWDKPFWVFETLGTEEWVTVGDIPGGSLDTVFEFTPQYCPVPYSHRALLFEGTTELDPDAIGFEFEFQTSSDTLRVIINAPIPINMRVEVQQSQGALEGPTATLPQALLDIGFRPAESTYEHHIPRVIRQGAVDRSNPSEGITGCDSSLPGGKPEERVPLEVIPSVNICVINTWEEALGAWDAAPWDTTGWDSPPVNVGNRIFIIAVGGQEEIPPATEVFPTHEDYQTGDPGFQPPYIIGSTEAYNRVAVEVQCGGVGPFLPVTEGVEYEVVDPFKNIIEFGAPPGQEFTADGATILFGPITIPTGIDSVRYNSVTITQGVDYVITNIAGDDYIDFTPLQPAPRSVTENFIQKSSWVEAQGGTEFEVNLPQASLTKDNVMVFRNGGLVPQAEYNVATTADVEFLMAQLLTDEIAVIALGNFRGDNQDLTHVQNDPGTGAQVVFNVGNNAHSGNTYVFVDGVYQTFGAPYDYTFSAPGTASAQVVFNVAPVFGTDVEIRVVNSPLGSMIPYVNTVHEVIVHPGGTTTTTGIFDLSDPNEVMVFVNGALQNGYGSLLTPVYYIQDTNPDSIEWVPGNEPAPGDIVTVRFMREVISSEVVVQDIIPTAGDFIEVLAVPYLVNADIVRYRYNGWPVGSLGPIEMVDYPDPGHQEFNGDNFTNIFPIGNNATSTNTTVFVDGVFQNVGTDYQFADPGLPTAAIVFTTPPPVGVNNIVVDTYLGYDLYTIADGMLTLPDPIPDVGLTVTVQFKEPRKGDLARSILVRMDLIAVDILPDHTAYDQPGSYDEGRKDGIIIVNTTDANYYQWSEGSSTWILYGAASPGDQFYVRRTMEIWEFDGASFNKLFEVGDAFTTPPLIPYPTFGRGILSGTYAAGQSPDASNDFPEAYEVMQHPGDCGSGS